MFVWIEVAGRESYKMEVGLGMTGAQLRKVLEEDRG
jgi:hypothetical protein